MQVKLELPRECERKEKDREKREDMPDPDALKAKGRSIL